MNKFNSNQINRIKNITANLLKSNSVNLDSLNDCLSYDVFITAYGYDNNILSCNGSQRQECLGRTISVAAKQVIQNCPVKSINKFLLTFLYNYSDLPENRIVVKNQGIYMYNEISRTFLLPSFLRTSNSDDIDEWINYGKNKMKIKLDEKIFIKVFETIEIEDNLK